MQISKRLVGMHPDKVLGALQNHIDSGHEKSAMQAIPDLQLQHPQFHNELEEIKARLGARLEEGIQVLNRKSAEVFRCVNCGGGLSIQNPESTHVICQYCGCNAEHPATNIQLERWNKALDLESNFTIGDFFEFDDLRWQAIGVQLFSGRLREYDREDGWETSYARYTSWWMLNERRELAWLTDDGRQRYWAEKYIPENPSVPDLKDKTYEHGVWQLEFAAGEFSYQPTLGERHQSAEDVSTQSMPIRPGGSAYRYYVSVDTRIDENDKPKEIEFIRSRRVPDSHMFKVLGNDVDLTDARRWKHSMMALLPVIPVLLVLMLFLNRGGEAVTTQVELDQQTNGVEVQSFTVAEAGTMLRMKAIMTTITNNSWMGVNLELQNSAGEPVYGKYLEYWRESGIDTDGSRWSESRRSFDWHMRVDEPDTYRILASTEPQSTNQATRFTLTSEPNRTSSTPFMLAGMLSIALLMLFRSKLSAVKAVAASISVKLKQRFNPDGKPGRQAEDAS